MVGTEPSYLDRLSTAKATFERNDYKITNEELKAAKEELQTLGEELEATKAEFKAAKDELELVKTELLECKAKEEELKAKEEELRTTKQAQLHPYILLPAPNDIEYWYLAEKQRLEVVFSAGFRTIARGGAHDGAHLFEVMASKEALEILEVRNQEEIRAACSVYRQ